MNRHSNLHTRSDLFILLITSFAIGILAAFTWPADANQQYVLIQTDSDIQLLDLASNSTHLIHSKFGNNLLEIHQQRVRFITSSCKNKICIKNGWLSTLKPMSACIPNQISAQLIGQNDSVFDAYSF